MVPHVRGRPLALHSFPQGIEGDGFFVKDAPRHFPEWIATVAVPKREGGTIHQVLADDAATLVYLAGQNVITPHVWTSRADRLEQPGPAGLRPRPVRASASPRCAPRRGRWATCCATLGLAPFAMTTGSRGLHVVVPLRRDGGLRDRPRLRPRGRRGAGRSRIPDTLTVEFRREQRGERIFVDVNRNAYGQHAVAPYAVRALPSAPVATPLRWEELGDRGLDPQGWTVATIGRPPRRRRRSVARHRPARAVDRPGAARARAAPVTAPRGSPRSILSER